MALRAPVSTMDEHALKVLEFPAVREMLAEHAATTLGLERIGALLPSASARLIEQRLQETSEALRLLETPGSFHFGGARDIRGAVALAAAGGVLDPRTLMDVAGTLECCRRLRALLVPRRESSPRLAELGERLQDFRALETRIHEVVNDAAEVRDDATPRLERIRRTLRQTKSRMIERLQAILRSPQYRDMIQDPIITTRDGRQCIPVKAEYRSQFGGLVHDQSSSGSTYFMEPGPVVELGNELRQEELREREEVERILRELSGLVGARGEDLAYALEALSELDLISSRARLALRQHSTRPELQSEGALVLRRARHPLLKGDVVPLDLEMDRDRRVIVITGPNTGGKTVGLKTVGLMAMMAQCGLYIPADEGSTLPIFNGVYADIGDEQSLQQSLSTFSGHITNISRILTSVEAGGGTALVLLDEVGAGTDPAEGAALARAILSRLLSLGALTIATTHYGELKEYAYATAGVENASVEFDTRTLRPTYRLLVGIPGASNALTIAARYGMPESVLAEAREDVGKQRLEVSDMIRRLTEKQRATEHELRRASETAREADAARKKAERELNQLRADRADTLNRARTQADELLRSARREAERMREELKRIERDARKVVDGGATPEGLQVLRDRLLSAGKRLQQSEERVERTAERYDSHGLEREKRAEKRLGVDAEPPKDVEEEPVLKLDSHPPAVGDLVWVQGFEQRGTLLTAPQSGKVQVLIGSMRVSVPEDSARRLLSPPAVSPQPAVPMPSQGDSRLQRRFTISPELRLLGKRAEEAIVELDSYLDDACMAGLSNVRIVHGKGSGALKRVVWEFLQRHTSVGAFRHPDEAEGGHGVTIAELKD